ncbi:hypothetical protein FRC15_001161 [Serendipita sp. 397]|nr:hypothetical protein FRC15_001161 [Serendipita sp. 397]
MALTLVSLAVLATTAMAAPMPQIIPSDSDVVDPTTTPAPTATSIPCKAQYISQKDDTCRSIGLPWGLYDYHILEANPFLNCEDIWVGTPICIPDVPLPDTVVYPTSTVVVPSCSTTHTAGVNETCDSIGAPYGISGADILAANPFLNCNDIWQYTPVCIPGVAVTDPPPTLSPTATHGTIVTTYRPAPTCYVTHTAGVNETCDSIGAPYGVSGDTILAANPFLNCNDIWQYTPVCIPGITVTTLPTSTSITTVPVPTCSTTHTAGVNETCDSIGAPYGISGDDILAANPFLNCNDIWQYTPVCIPFIIITDTFPTVEPTPTITSTVPVPTCIMTHTAGINETCDSIGELYGISGADILAANTFLNCNDIWQYTPVCIPPVIVIDTFPTAQPTETI